MSSESYVDDACVAFVIHCDENDLTLDEGFALAERIGDALRTVAEARKDYARAT